MVKPEHFSVGDHVELLIWISLLIQNVITRSQKQSEKLKTLVSDREELAALKRRVDDEKWRTCISRKSTSSFSDSSRNKGRSSRHKNTCSRSSSRSKRKRTKVSHCFPRVLTLNDSSWILKSFHHRA
jgi:hypothetical protein